MFGESQSRVVISVRPDDLKKAREVIESFPISYRNIGWVGGSRALKINGLISVPVPVLKATWRNAIVRRL